MHHMMHWDDYRLILALARAGSIRGAALLLSVNHGTVSRRLAHLSDALKGEVFERIPGGYRPTDLGVELIAAAEQMEQAALEAERRSRSVNTAIRGPVTLSIPEVIGRHLLLDDLSDLCALYPEIRLKAEVSYGFADLDRSEADIAIRGTDYPPDHLVGRRLCKVLASQYCARDYLDQVAEGARRWIARSHDPKHHGWITRSPYPDTPVGIAISDIGLRHEAGARGKGMIFGACYIADQDPRLMRLPSHTLEPIADLWVLTHPDLKNVPRISRVMAFLYERLASYRDLIEGQRPQNQSL